MRLRGRVPGERRIDVALEQFPDLGQLDQQMLTGTYGHLLAIVGLTALDPALISVSPLYLLGQFTLDLAKKVTDNEINIRPCNRPHTGMTGEEHLEEQIEYLDNLAPHGQVRGIDEVDAGIALVRMGDLIDKSLDCLIGQTVLVHFQYPLKRPGPPAYRLCLKTRSGFVRLIFRLTASGCIDDKTNIACFAVLPGEKTPALGPTTEFSERA